MTPEEANAVVEEAIARSLGKQEEDSPEVKEFAEYEELANIHMAALSDWTVQLAWIVADKKWDKADNALLAANHALQKLAGCVGKLVPTEGQK